MTTGEEGDWKELTLEEIDADDETGKEFARQALRQFCHECGLHDVTDEQIELKLAPLFRKHDENLAPLRARMQRQRGPRLAIVRGGRHDRR